MFLILVHFPHEGANEPKIKDWIVEKCRNVLPWIYRAYTIVTTFLLILKTRIGLYCHHQQKKFIWLLSRLYVLSASSKELVTVFPWSDAKYFIISELKDSCTLSCSDMSKFTMKTSQNWTNVNINVWTVEKKVFLTYIFIFNFLCSCGKRCWQTSLIKFLRHCFWFWRLKLTFKCQSWQKIKFWQYFCKMKSYQKAKMI